MAHEREAAIRNWWAAIDEEQREELMWTSAGVFLSHDQVTSMEEAGIVLEGRKRVNQVELEFTMPADVASFIANST